MLIFILLSIFLLAVSVSVIYLIISAIIYEERNSSLYLDEEDLSLKTWNELN